MRRKKKKRDALKGFSSFLNVKGQYRDHPVTVPLISHPRPFERHDPCDHSR